MHPVGRALNKIGATRRADPSDPEKLYALNLEQWVGADPETTWLEVFIEH